MKLTRNNNRVIFKRIAIIWTIMGFIIDVAYLAYYGKYLVDSDMAAEMILSDLLNQEHSVLSHNWFYGNELRFFFLQWFYRLGLYIFPLNWNIARAFGMGIFYIVFIFVAYWFSKSCDYMDNSIWFSATLLWPFGFWYHFLGTYGGYYLVYICFTLFELSCIINYSNCVSLDGNSLMSRKQGILITAGIIIAICTGINGVRQTLSVFFPTFVSAIVLIIIRIVKNQKLVKLSEFITKNRREIGILFSSTILIIFNVIGYAINLLILTKRYSFQRQDGIGILSRFRTQVLNEIL